MHGKLSIPETLSFTENSSIKLLNCTQNLVNNGSLESNGEDD